MSIHLRALFIFIAFVAIFGLCAVFPNIIGPLIVLGFIAFVSYMIADCD